MKKIALFVSVLLLAGSLFAQDDASAKVDALAKKVPALGGSVTFKFGDADLFPATLGFDSAKSGTVGSLNVGIDNEQVSAGVTIGVTPSITKVAGLDPVDTSKTGSIDYYDLAKKVIEFARAKNGKTFGDNDTVLTTTAYNTAVAGLTTAQKTLMFKDATATGDIADKSSKTDDVAVYSAIYAALATAIATDIDNMGGAAAVTYTAQSTTTVGQLAVGSTTNYVVIEDGVLTATTVTAAQAKLLKDEVVALKAYKEYVLGKDTDDTWAAAFPVSNAFFKIKKIFGVIDLGLLVEGKKVSVGSLVSSINTTAADANLGVSLGLSSGVVEGVSAEVMLNGSKPKDSVSNNIATYKDESADASAVTWGLLLNAGYKTDMFGVKVGYGIEDFSDAVNTMILEINPSLSLKEVAGLSLDVDAVFSEGFKGFGLGAKVGASVMGITPSLTLKYKTAAFAGDDSWNLDGTDSTDDASVTSDFNSEDNQDAFSFDFAVGINLKDIIGMSLVSVNGGFNGLVVPAVHLGYNVGINLDFTEVAKLPVTFGWSLSKYNDNDMTNTFDLGYKYGAATFGAQFKLATNDDGTTDEDATGFMITIGTTF